MTRQMAVAGLRKERRLQNLVDLYQHEFQRTKNPLFVWRARQAARGLDKPVKWIDEYFDLCEARFLECLRSDLKGDVISTERSRKNRNSPRAAEIAAWCVGFEGKKGHAYFREAQQFERDFAIYSLVRERTDASEVPQKVFEDIGKHRGLGLKATAVRAAYRKIAKLVEKTEIGPLVANERNFSRTHGR